MDWPHTVVAAGQELKDAERSSGVTVLIKDGFDYMGCCDENTVLSNEKPSPDRRKHTISLLGDDREDGVAEISLGSVACLG
jgi:hypothetical protein